MNDTKGSEPQGCLAKLLSLIGITLAEPTDAGRELPYRLRDDFLSPAEYSFYRVLVSAIGDRTVVCPKVNLADVFFVARPQDNQRYRNKIDRKHVDFLLCEPTTMRPLCGVELDDSSHARRDRQERDVFVDEVFRVAGLPLLRVPAQSGYNPASLRSLVEQHLQKGAAAPPQEPAATGATTSNVPMCPKCGVPMVARTAKKGPGAGQTFYGCANYPRCREIA